jgi:[ribosomal protein S18]-alanine N-acetyltransferase
MTIRAATAANIDALVALHARVFEAGWDHGELSDFVERDLVLVADDPVIGFIIIRQALDEAEIITLVVDPLARKLGHGALLLRQALDSLLKNNVAKVFLEVAIDNYPAICLYQGAGFLQIGLRKAYYKRQTGPAIDALVMSKRLAE